MDDKLTLVDENEQSIELHRRGVTHIAFANAEVEFVVATGINDAGDLLTTEFTAIRAGRTRHTFFESTERKLKTRESTMILTQETGPRRITIEEARRMISRPTAVVVAYRQDARRPGGDSSRERQHKLWKRTGSVSPVDEAVYATFSRIVRPGTLVFILSTRENEAVP